MLCNHGEQVHGNLEPGQVVEEGQEVRHDPVPRPARHPDDAQL